MISLGIDIGKNGAIVAIKHDGEVKTFKTPQINKEIDIHRLVEIIDEVSNGGKESIHAGIEDVHSIFGVGAKANFQFGRSLGIIEGLIISFGFPFTKISPKIWQKEMWMGISPVQINTGKKTKEGNIKYKIDTKSTSQLAAKRLYPSLDLRGTERSKKDHDGIVDALLIATYVSRKFK